MSEEENKSKPTVTEVINALDQVSKNKKQVASSLSNISRVNPFKEAARASADLDVEISKVLAEWMSFGEDD